MRIAIANDSPLAIEAIRQAIGSAQWAELAWVARDGLEAVHHASIDRPDLILMDLHLPLLNGVEATKRIMFGSPCAVLVVTADIERSHSLVFEALGEGALDAVNLPPMERNSSRPGASALLEKLELMRRLLRPDLMRRSLSELQRPDLSDVSTGCSRLLAVGASAGGPAALAALLQSLENTSEFAVVIVQHIGLEFAPALATWLNGQSPVPVTLVEQRCHLESGRTYVAGAGDHLVVEPSGELGLAREPVDCIYKPSVDVFFSSVARNWRGRSVGVLLTGMGSDGAKGLLEMRNAGHYTIAQDKATSAVFGMPKAAAAIGAPMVVLGLDEIGKAAVRRLIAG